MAIRSTSPGSGMNVRVFHGNITPNDIGRALIARFNRGNLRAQQFGSGDKAIVQIASTARPISGGQTALTVSLQKAADGVSVQIGQQSWLGVVASLGFTALWTWLNPWNILSRLDDLAQDIENLQMVDQVWDVVEATARAAGASFELSERLKRMVCAYCNTANPVGESRCIACGAPLGDVQPATCQNCGFVVTKNELICPNCGRRLIVEKKAAP
jgi:DNA-directed RNA polymerase subunit RPC12/RpoP